MSNDNQDKRAPRGRLPKCSETDPKWVEMVQEHFWSETNRNGTFQICFGTLRTAAPVDRTVSVSDPASWLSVGLDSGAQCA